jgi:hypothetical protein
VRCGAICTKLPDRWPEGPLDALRAAAEVADIGPIFEEWP